MTVPDGITLPTSTSQSINTLGVMIQVSPSKIWVDDKEVLDSSQAPKRLYDQGKRRIIPLYNELVKNKKFKRLQKHLRMPNHSLELPT